MVALTLYSGRPVLGEQRNQQSFKTDTLMNILWNHQNMNDLQIYQQRLMGPLASHQQNLHNKIQIDHCKFRSAELLEENDIIRTHIPIDNQFYFEQWSNNLSKIARLDDQVLLFPRTYRYIKRAICGSSGELQIDFDYYQFILENQLINRRKDKLNFFDQSELWYLLYSLVNAAHNFKILNSKIGDVRPSNIFINQQGQIKISNVFSWPDQPTNYIKTLNEHQKTYLAPQQMESMRLGQQETYIDKYRAESFSIGITLLQSALMRSMASLYNPYTKNFDAQRFRQHLKDWWSLSFQNQDKNGQSKTQHKYSNALKAAIASLCEIEADQRTTSEQIFTWLKNYEGQINDLEEFDKSVIPLRNIQKYNTFLSSDPSQNRNQNYTNSHTHNYPNSHTQNYPNIHNQDYINSQNYPNNPNQNYPSHVNQQNRQPYNDFHYKFFHKYSQPNYQPQYQSNFTGANFVETNKNYNNSNKYFSEQNANYKKNDPKIWLPSKQQNRINIQR